MTKRQALPESAIEALHELAQISAGRPYAAEHALLSHCGLIDIKHGRFGAYTCITEAGRQHLARMASSGGRAATKPRGPGGTRGVLKSIPEAATGLATDGAVRTSRTSLRGAVPRPSRITAKQARVHVPKP